VPQAVSLWLPECNVLTLAITHSGERSQDNTERRILCNFKMSTLLPIAA
jgi:hypothetical protein